MNLFLIGRRATGGVDARAAEEHLRELLPLLPPPRPDQVERWLAPSGRAVVVCAAHKPNLVGGVRYAHLERERIALFSGRPIVWAGDAEADGRSVLDPRFYLAPASEWRERMDGRYAAISYDDRDGELEVSSDSLGAYPLFFADQGGTQWLANNADLVRRLVGARELNRSVLASVLGTGWSLSGEPAWEGVQRLPARLPLHEIATMSAGGFDPARAARLLVEASGGLADWPGRPRLLQLSGGRDSRLLLAAVVTRGTEVEVASTGEPGHPDVDVARRLCEVVGVEHRRREPGAGPQAGVADRARLLALTSGGGSSLEDADGYFAAAGAGMWLLLSGQGGEIARTYYGSGDGLDRDVLVRRLLDLVLTSGDLLNPDGRRLVEAEVGRAVDTALAAGVASRDVPDAFYLSRRMAGWAASGHGCVEYAKGDTVCPLWSRRLLAQQFGLPAEERARELFPQATLEALSPELAAIPYADRPPLQPLGSDGFEDDQDLVGEAVAGEPSSPAWEVLDRGCVERLLASPPGSLDRRQRRRVWRLATVFMGLRA